MEMCFTASSLKTGDMPHTSCQATLILTKTSVCRNAVAKHRVKPTSGETPRQSRKLPNALLTNGVKHTTSIPRHYLRCFLHGWCGGGNATWDSSL